MSTPGSENLEQWRPDLMRYAVLQLRDPQLAEDVVQETLLAGLEGLAKFTGKSSAKTWLISILRHKITDAIRRKLREQTRISPSEEEEMGEAIDDLFTADGKWKQLPSNWGKVGQHLQITRFAEEPPRFPVELLIQPVRAKRLSRQPRAADRHAIQREVYTLIAERPDHVVLQRIKRHALTTNGKAPEAEEPYLG